MRYLQEHVTIVDLGGAEENLLLDVVLIFDQLCVELNLGQQRCLVPLSLISLKLLSDFRDHSISYPFVFAEAVSFEGLLRYQPRQGHENA